MLKPRPERLCGVMVAPWRHATEIVLELTNDLRAQKTKGSVEQRNWGRMRWVGWGRVKVRLA